MSRHVKAAITALRAMGRRLLHGCRRHPILLTAPLAVLAVGAGFAAQELIPAGASRSDPDLLEALIAQPREVSQQAADSSEAPDKDLLAAASLQAQRTSLSHPDPALVEPEAGAEVPLEIRVALLGASPHPDWAPAATGDWWTGTDAPFRRAAPLTRLTWRRPWPDGPRSGWRRGPTMSCRWTGAPTKAA